MCETCGHRSETDNDFNTLYIEVHGHADLLSSLRAEFKTQGGEAPTGYCCERCKAPLTRIEAELKQFGDRARAARAAEDPEEEAAAQLGLEHARGALAEFEASGVGACRQFTSIREAPYVLSVALKRSVDNVTKLNDRFEFPLELDVGPYLQGDSAGEEGAALTRAVSTTQRTYGKDGAEVRFISYEDCHMCSFSRLDTEPSFVPG